MAIIPYEALAMAPKSQTRHAAVFDMEVTGTDAGQSDPHNGIPVMEQDGLGLVL